MNTLLRRVVILVVLSSLLFTLRAQADYVGGITFSQPVPSFMPSAEYVDVNVDYKVDEAGGGRIFILPFTNGSPTPGYAVSGGPLVGPGTGSVNLRFRITTGSPVVDQLRVRLTSPDQSQTWLEGFVPAYFAYGPSGVFNVVPDRREGSALRHGQPINIAFDYATNDPAGCRILARPYYHGALVPGYGASGSGTLPQSGSFSQWFYFNADADISDIHFTIRNHDGSVVLREFDVPYELHWRAIGIYDIQLDREYESSLHNSESVVATFTLDHAETDVVQTWARCMTDGVSTPGSVFQGSVPAPAGAHTVTRTCRVSTGEQDVDAIRVYATTGSVTTSVYVPVRMHWGPHAIQNVVFTPSSPALLTNDERLTMTFSYRTDATAGVRIFGWPALDYVLLAADHTSASPLYSPPTGNGSFWYTFTSGNHVSDSARLKMTNGDQTVTHLTFFKHGQWAWGRPVTITPVPGAEALAAARLGIVYPNPFNPVATVPLDLAADAVVRLAVYDVRGRLVRVLADGPLAVGHHDLRFDGTGLASGTYVCRLEGPGGVQSERVTLVK